MKQFCSLKDIASAAGVSTALVSYVLNRKLSAKIRPETAKRIRSIAADLNYIPNYIARSLKSERTLTVGLVMADISNFYYSNIARVIEDECARTGYNLIFGNADEHAGKFKEVVDFFIRRQVDGLILATPWGAESQLNFLNSGSV